MLTEKKERKQYQIMSYELSDFEPETGKLRKVEINLKIKLLGDTSYKRV